MFFKNFISLHVLMSMTQNGNTFSARLQNVTIVYFLSKNNNYQRLIPYRGTYEKCIVENQTFRKMPKFVSIFPYFSFYMRLRFFSYSLEFLFLSPFFVKKYFFCFYLRTAFNNTVHFHSFSYVRTWLTKLETSNFDILFVFFNVKLILRK